MSRYDNLDTDNKLIWNLRDIGHTLRKIDEGKGSRQRILITLLELGPLPQSVLTKQLGIQPASASEAIIKLEAAGLMERGPNPSDHRTMVVALTGEGRKAAEAAKLRRRQRHRKMFMCLEEEEKRLLLGWLERLNASWDVEFRSVNHQDHESDAGV